MSRAGVAFLVVTAIFVIGGNCQLCGPDETFVDCPSGCGEQTCQSRPLPPDANCPAVCRPSCICNYGLTRREHGGPCVQQC
ncbi:cysteine-rich venom protein 6-like [Fopius arisanus]|uniref:Cysteine-rich venom protein 6-like n=1 Tax=Fopius arisanus TaxID=64838 RepID=A0A9R1SXY1_9HYME|nr:PREDICTED: cysteine-rich venom protein 6-like [Fopius arisanus]